jgi:hypothetical protein
LKNKLKKQNGSQLLSITAKNRLSFSIETGQESAVKPSPGAI